MHTRFTSSRKTGFSLVELSIVLVILGLLIGGILAGRSLIRAAELRSIPTDYAKHRTAIYSFRDKYFMLPGDMNNATSFWGSAGGSGSNQLCFDAVSTGKETCNGDGNGQIKFMYDDGSYASLGSEAGRAWQHLANAAIIEGPYKGQVYSTVRFGVNVPGSKYPKAGFSLGYADNSNFTVFNASQLTNVLFFGAADYAANQPILKPEDAWNIDTKMDDSNPTMGDLYVEPEETACFTGTTPNTSYAITASTNECSFRLKIK